MYFLQPDSFWHDASYKGSLFHVSGGGGNRSSGFTFVNFGMLKEFLNSALHRNLPFCYHKSASINDLAKRTIVFSF